LRLGVCGIRDGCSSLFNVSLLVVAGSECSLHAPPDFSGGSRKHISSAAYIYKTASLYLFVVH
jgi:hypothetical protein